MFTLLLVAASLAAWAVLSTLLGLVLGRLIRRGEQQARHIRRARHTAAHARTDRYGDHR